MSSNTSIRPSEGKEQLVDQVYDLESRLRLATMKLEAEKVRIKDETEKSDNLWIECSNLMKIAARTAQASDSQLSRLQNELAAANEDLEAKDSKLIWAKNDWHLKPKVSTARIWSSRNSTAKSKARGKKQQTTSGSAF